MVRKWTEHSHIEIGNEIGKKSKIIFCLAGIAAEMSKFPGSSKKVDFLSSQKSDIINAKHIAESMDGDTEEILRQCWQEGRVDIQFHQYTPFLFYPLKKNDKKAGGVKIKTIFRNSFTKSSDFGKSTRKKGGRGGAEFVSEDNYILFLNCALFIVMKNFKYRDKHTVMSITFSHRKN